MTTEEPRWHTIFAYGQQSFEGWACRDCLWEGPPTIDHISTARSLHDLQLEIESLQAEIDALTSEEQRCPRDSFTFDEHYDRGFSDGQAEQADRVRERAEKIRGNIHHHVNPVIGWLRWFEAHPEAHPLSVPASIAHLYNAIAAANELLTILDSPSTEEQTDTGIRTVLDQLDGTDITAVSVMTGLSPEQFG